ncbi:MAG: carbon-nitrogen family hydrolase [Planctomycetota bacterium]|nr:MAG: carbon-nitrogen family hydrolase [Planctomycetota bacterium]
MHFVGVQLDIKWEDKPANHERLRELLGATEIAPGSVIVVPEMFDTGFSMNVAVTAQSPARESERVLQDLAVQYRSVVMGGVAAPIEDGKSRNEAVVFAPDGGLLGRYQKMQPFSHSGEHLVYPPGDRPLVFEWQGVRVAPFICYDLRFPELFRAAVRQGAELFWVIACWPAKRSEHWVRLLQARAIENLAGVVGVNRCGQEPGLVFDGRSAAFDHMGRTLFEADAGEQVFHVDVDIDALRAWRDHFPALRDMRTEWNW